MREYIKTGLTLMLITLIAGLGLSLVYTLVKEPIEKAEISAKIKAIEKVLTDSNTGELLIERSAIPETAQELSKYEWLPSGFTPKEGFLYISSDGKGKVLAPAYVFRAKDGSKIYILTGQAVGYGGNVITIAAFVEDTSGIRLNAIKVIEYSQETPGLGAKIADENIQKRFYPITKEGLEKHLKVDKDSGKGAVNDEMEMERRRNTEGIIQTSDVMTGATITPRAVVTSINAMYEFLKKAGVN
ncbi:MULTISPECIES: RnfABCDGE type electron transport complex subunit G [unclassified Kosmotoga]|jgi:electron transport complex protein RnfG|uniref:RnfABCDGE type electron transport complex subunit G n=1 Tax=unclassified Kosmotoga TaxID=2631489 RepID=UPI0007C5A790|nr:MULTISPECIES: RnfABCDGE type electron transport complex subunit G [unclassified Kosmotoga]MDI3523864.1 H+/Na+-translocating ferredoxin:NAD+ oxidoreductase subunit [Kosmotoga sp.]MDK2953118.1 H+/Na+-translocating ferredoxin:NAD+ oxidoreductase subunit [Kosmotoga sp.]OAA22161.1 electron transporter RnfG [Kosmotoga sp. DU53]